VSDDGPRGGYFAWRTAVRKRQSTPDIDDGVELLLRECWSMAYDRGRKEGVVATASLRRAADAYRDFGDMVERWELEREALAVFDNEFESLEPSAAWRTNA